MRGKERGSVHGLFVRSNSSEGAIDAFNGDVAPNLYPAAIGVWRSVMPSWAVMAAVCEAEPSVERSAADRRAAA